jgi:hypothetical protein
LSSSRSSAATGFGPDAVERSTSPLGICTVTSATCEPSLAREALPVSSTMTVASACATRSRRRILRSMSARSLSLSSRLRALMVVFTVDVSGAVA